MMSEMTSLERDTISRNRIISETDKNFFVEAGAGSGKTTMLVNRMVAMVESGIDIDKICAITFTKAAAGEFYERFYEKLSERCNPEFKWVDKGFAGQLPKPTDKTREYCSRALQKIDLCFMGTIDSFCKMVLSEHPSEAGIPSDIEIISDDEAEIIYKQEYVKICDGEYDKTVRELSDLAYEFRNLFWNDEEVFASAMSFLMNNRNVRFEYNTVAPVNIDEAYKLERRDLLRAVECMAEHPEIISETNDNTRKAKTEINDILNILSKNWNSDFQGIIKALNTLSGINVIPEGLEQYGIVLADLFEPGKKKPRDNSQQIIIGQEGGLYWKLHNYRYSLSMTFFCSCISLLERVLCAKGKMTFFDCLYYLRNMLARDIEEQDGRLVRHIQKRHRHFLIDEFQDTNPLQAEVFFYLCADRPVIKWSDCIPRPGSMFVVGDPKQSIYRFRGADVDSFENVKTLFKKTGGDILALTRNFRSTGRLCDYYNGIFTKIFKGEADGQIKFEEIPIPESRDDEFQGVYKYKAYTGKLEESHPEETNPAQIARIIEKLVGNDEYKIRDVNDDSPRPVEYKDIMVITYGKKSLDPIMRAFKERDIPTRVEGSVPFSACEGLKELYRIYAAMAEPSDNIAVYAALTGKLYGVSDGELQAYAESNGRLSIFQDYTEIPDSETSQVVSKLQHLHEFYIGTRFLSPAALYNKIMDDYRVFVTVSSENLEVVFYAGELLRNAEEAGTVVSFKDGAEFIRKMLEGNSDEERCLSFNQNRNAVHMANLHKVKGLEAPVVILSSALKTNNINKYRIIHTLNENPVGYLFALSNSESYGYFFETNMFNTESRDEKNARDYEKDRLGYVAATRARNALIICDSIRKNTNPNAKSEGIHQSVWGNLLRGGKENSAKINLPDFFGDEIEQIKRREINYINQNAKELYDMAEKTCVLKERSSETASYLLENPSRLHLVSKMVSDESNAVLSDMGGITDIDRKENTINIAAHRYPALLGTMTHRLMEVLVSTKNKVDPVKVIDEIIREYITPSGKEAEADLRAALADAAEKMRGGGYPQSNGLPQDMLGTFLDADEVYCEVPFCYCEETDGRKVIWNGIMDVIYCKDGKWHIVDYKTNVDGSDLDYKYRNQLEAYIRALREITGEDADAYIYHIDI